MQLSDNNVTKKLQKYFSISIKKSKNGGSAEVYPAKWDIETDTLKPIKMDSDIQRIFNEWTGDLTRPEELRNRMQRYSDLDFMVCNCGYIQTAIKLYANETICPDETGKVIGVSSKDRKVEDYINKFLSRIGVNRQVLEDTAYNISKYADSFWINSIDPKEGIVEITPIDVRQVKERIEFSAIEVMNSMYQSSTSWQSYASTTINMQDIVDAIKNKVKDTDYAAMYKKYLFGYSLGVDESMILPPWAITHFRRFSSQSEFMPFGRPLLINSLSLFREYKSNINLLAMARVAKFPKEVFSVDVSGMMNPEERMLAVNSARQKYQNYITSSNGKEEMGIGSSVWIAKDTIDYQLFENNMNLDDIADVELSRDELISSTLAPKDYILNNNSGGWDAGKALLQQSKIFAREVFTNQTAILTALTELIKTQFVIMDLFQGEDTEFELTLSFPNSEQTTDSINAQKDTMDLANATIENLKTALAIDSIPPEVAKDIFKTYSSIKTSDLDRWFNQIQKSTDLQVKQADDFTDSDYKAGEMKEARIRKIMNERLNENVFKEAIFGAKKRIAFEEGVLNNEHFYYSYQNTRTQALKYQVLRELKQTCKLIKD